MIDIKTYFVKSGMPGIYWKSPWTDRMGACDEAKDFVMAWKEIGVDAKAIVFYRDGTPIMEWTVAGPNWFTMGAMRP